MRSFWASLLSTYAAWVTFWLSVGLFAGWRWNVAQDFWMVAHKSNDLIGMQVGNESSQFFAQWIQWAMIYGGLWPLPVVLSIAVGGLVFDRISHQKGNKKS